MNMGECLQNLGSDDLETRVQACVVLINEFPIKEKKVGDEILPLLYDYKENHVYKGILNLLYKDFTKATKKTVSIIFGLTDLELRFDILKALAMGDYCVSTNKRAVQRISDSLDEVEVYENKRKRLELLQDIAQYGNNSVALKAIEIINQTDNQETRIKTLEKITYNCKDKIASKIVSIIKKTDDILLKYVSLRRIAMNGTKYAASKAIKIIAKSKELGLESKSEALQSVAMYGNQDIGFQAVILIDDIDDLKTKAELWEYLVMYGDKGISNKSLLMIRNIDDEKIKSEAIKTISTQARIEQTTDIVYSIREINDLFIRAKTLQYISRFGRQNIREVAKSFLSHFVDIFAQIKDPNQRKKALGYVVDVGRPEAILKAKNYLRQM